MRDLQGIHQLRCPVPVLPAQENIRPGGHAESVVFLGQITDSAFLRQGRPLLVCWKDASQDFRKS